MSNNINKGGSLGLATCVTMIVGGMIGSAIFSLSGLTMYNAGPAAILSWIIAAAIMLMYGLIVAELSSRFPKSGGVFVFPARALGKTEKQGNFWGWISTWGYINANIVAVAFAAIYVATYLGVSFPALSKLQIPLAIASIALCLVLNAVKFSITGKANLILVGGLIAAILIYVISSFASGKWDGSMLSPFFSQGAGGGAGFLSSVPVAMVGYGSIVAIAFMVSEVKNPNKNVLRSIFIAMSIVVAIYTAIILATVGLISAQFLVDNPGMRYIPLFAASFTKLQALPWVKYVISIAAVLALLTTMLVVLALTGRAIQAASQKQMLPAFFAKNNKAGVPFNATLIVALIAAVLSCFPSLTSTIVGFGALFAAITLSINIISLMVARRKFRDQEIGFRAPGGIVVPILALVLIVTCYIPDIINGGWKIWLFTIGWYLIGLLVFAIMAKVRGNKGTAEESS